MGFSLSRNTKDKLGAAVIACLTLFFMFKLVTYTPVDKNAETVRDAAIATQVSAITQQQTKQLQTQQQRISNLEARVLTQDKSIKQLYDYIFQLDVTADEVIDAPVDEPSA